MANLVEFIVRMRDMTSGPLQKLGVTGQNSFSKIGQSMDKLSGKSMSLGNNISQIDAKVNQLEKSSNRATNSLSNLFRTGLAIAGIGSLAYLGKDIMQAGIGRQMDLTALQTLVGKGPGDILNKQILDFAIKSPYGGEVMTEGKLLAGSGVSARNIPHLLHLMGDIALADKERMKSLALGFAEASTRGNLNGQVERMFIQGGLFSPVEQIHKMTGRSTESLKKDMEKGKISIEMLVKAMEYATGPLGRWYHAMENAMKTPAGKWTAFMGTLNVKIGSLGLKLMPIVGLFASFGNALLSNTPAIYGIAAAIGTMTAAWALYTIYTERAAIWQGILAVLAYWPLALVGALAAGITYLCLKYDNWGKSMMIVWNVAKNVAIGIYDIFKFAIDDTGNMFDRLGLRIKATFEFIGGMLANTGRAIKLALHGDFTEAGKALSAPIKTEAGLRLDKRSITDAATFKAHGDILKKLFDDKQLKGLDFSMNNPKKGKSLLDAMGYGKYTPDGASGATGSLGADTTSSITGGGVRNVTINVAKFQDKTEIHSVNLKESTHEIEEIFQDMFLRITNSAAAMLY